MNECECKSMGHDDWCDLHPVNKLRLQVRELEILKARLTCCLEKYAEPENWVEGSDDEGIIVEGWRCEFRICYSDSDGGQLARKALGRGD
jgi:hypothetical protein